MAQTVAERQRKYRQNNREKVRVAQYRSKAKKYLSELADIKDLEEFKSLINQREKELRSEVANEVQ